MQSALLFSAIPGVDSVTNNVPTTGGLDAESDLALRQRATLFFASLSRGTLMAVLAAATSVQQGLQIGVVENSPQAGQFVVVADDGSGNPPASLLSAIYAAVDAIRPIGSVFTVIAPSTVSATISINLTTTGIVNRPRTDCSIGECGCGYGQQLADWRHTLHQPYCGTCL